MKEMKDLKYGLNGDMLTGFAEDALGYFVSKHGVVQLTRWVQRIHIFDSSYQKSILRTLNKSFHDSGCMVCKK